MLNRRGFFWMLPAIASPVLCRGNDDEPYKREVWLIYDKAPNQDELVVIRKVLCSYPDIKHLIHDICIEKRTKLYSSFDLNGRNCGVIEAVLHDTSNRGIIHRLFGYYL